MGYFEKVFFEVTTTAVTDWSPFEKIGPLFILTSGHTEGSEWVWKLVEYEDDDDDDC